MTATIASSQSTYHAPAERAGADEIAQSVTSISANPLIDSLLGAYPEIAMVLNRHRQIIFANQTLLHALGDPPAERVLGQRPGEAVNCTYAHDLPGGCGTSEHCRTCGAVNTILSCLNQREQAVGECQILVDTPNGPATLELEVKATPLPIDGKDYVVLAGRDISPLKRRAALEQAFFHDALNLAGGAQAIVRLLVDEDPSDRPMYLQRLEVISRQIVEQIRSQRDLAQAETGELKPRIERIEARQIMEEVRVAYEYHPVAAGRIIRCVPPIPSDISLLTDLVLLGRTLGNLVKNALEASNAGEAVTLRCELAGPQQLVFSVHNSACMPRDVQLQLFRRSFSTKQSSGRGIGTFSVKLLTERYLGGKVDFASDPEKGTTFYVRLPRGDLAKSDLPVPAVAEPDGQALRGMRVLLAEDDSAIRRLMEVFLRKAGAEVISVEDGQAAIYAIDTMNRGGGTIDVVLLDLDMPRVTGYEAAPIIRARGFTGPVLALSAHDAASDGPRCLAAGCSGYLEKPVRPKTLIDAIVAHLPAAARKPDASKTPTVLVTRGHS